MILARLTPINTRTNRGLAIVQGTLAGRCNQDRTDMCNQPIRDRPALGLA